MKAYIDEILRTAQEESRLLMAGEALLRSDAAKRRALRLCFSALLLILLMATPTSGFALA